MTTVVVCSPTGIFKSRVCFILSVESSNVIDAVKSYEFGTVVKFPSAFK